MPEPERCSQCGDVHDGFDVCPRTGLRLGIAGPCGTQVDRYHVERLLGAGGFGAVYRARHVHSHQPVALKLLRRELAADPRMIKRFFTEAQAAAAIDDPRIVRVTDCGETSAGDAFLVMELLEGADLRERSRASGGLTQRRVVEILIEVLEALEVAHARGVVHRDLKPANVFLASIAGQEHVKVLDFGISKIRVGDGQHAMTGSNTSLGTPTYMAPEQMRNARDVDGRADVYSVAAMAYELLCGVPPFAGETYEGLVLQVLTEPPAPLSERNPRLPKALCATVEHGLAKNPDERWQTARDFAHALREVLPHTTTDAVSPGAMELSGLGPTHVSGRAPVAASATPAVPRAQLATGRGPTPRDAVAPADQRSTSASPWTAMMLLVAVVCSLIALGVSFTSRRADAPVPPPTTVVQPAPVPVAVAPAPVVTTPEPLPRVEPPPPPPLAPARRQRPTPASAAVVHDPRVIGTLKMSDALRLMTSVRTQGSLEECRGAHDVTVPVQLHTHGKGLTIAQPDPSQAVNDKDAARCVANRFKAVAEKWSCDGSGIITVSVTLPAR
ncbi:MAG: protein kinase [Myxococcales bacterium]|nr:protein kinase [Myxococcales bacterium]